MFTSLLEEARCTPAVCSRAGLQPPPAPRDGRLDAPPPHPAEENPGSGREVPSPSVGQVAATVAMAPWPHLQAHPAAYASSGSPEERGGSGHPEEGGGSGHPALAGCGRHSRGAVGSSRPPGGDQDRDGRCWQRQWRAGPGPQRGLALPSYPPVCARAHQRLWWRRAWRWRRRQRREPLSGSQPQALPSYPTPAPALLAPWGGSGHPTHTPPSRESHGRCPGRAEASREPHLP